MQLSRRAIDAGAMDFPVRGTGSLVSTRTQASTWWRRASKGCTPTAAHQEPHALRSEVGPGAAGRIPDEEGHGETLVGVLVPGARQPVDSTCPVDGHGGGAARPW